MERQVFGIAKGVIDGVKQPLKGATICAAYFDGTLYDPTSSQYCTSSDSNGNFKVTVPNDFDNVKMTHVGQKPLIIDLNEWSDFCNNGECRINLSTEASNSVLPEVTIDKPKPDGSVTKVLPLKKVLLIGGGALALIGLGVLIYQKTKK